MATTTTERVERSVSDLHSKENSLLPIFRLPPEILEHIFTHAARDYYEDTDCSGFQVPDWVNVSYVCSHWRNVALNCPTLWAYHFTVSSRWTDELLARSRHASLKIRIHCQHGKTKSWWLHLVDKVLNHAGRIQEFHLIVPDDAFPRALSWNISRFRFLEIHFPDCPPQCTFNINNGDAALRTLKLDHCSLPWHSLFNLSGVTTLSLCFVPLTSRQSLPGFLTTLSRMQALTILHLEDALPRDGDFLSNGAFGDSPRVTLPRLARFFVYDPLFTVVGLLSRVDIPLKTKLRIEIEAGNNSPIDFAHLLSFLERRYSQSEDLSSIPTFRSLIVRFHHHHSDFRLECGDWDPSLSYPPQGYDIPLVICVTLSALIERSRGSRIISDICCSIPLTYVQTLHVLNPPFEFSDDFWMNTLGRFDGLRCMRLSHGNMPSLARSLLSHTDGPADAPRHTYVPELEELKLFHITFSSGRSEEFISAQQSLVVAMSSRKMLRLTMTECDVE